MDSTPSGHIEQLPSGSYRAKLYAGTDPLTGKEIRFRKTCKDYASAQVALGKFIEQAMADREPETGATVAKLLEVYSGVAEWDVSTRDSFEGYIRRVIRPALCHLKVREVHGPILDMLYSRLKKCGDLACTGKPFTEHRNVPDLRPGTANKKVAWKLVAGRLREAVASGQLPAGSGLPSVRDLYDHQGIPTATGRRAFAELAEEGLIVVRHGRTATVAGEPEEPAAPGIRRWRPGPGHDCALAGCQRHECSPLKPSSIRQIHSILSGAFAAAKRWGWVDENPAESAKPPTVTQQKKKQAVPAGDVAKVIMAARELALHQIALYLWLAAITGARRGELCATQLKDVDLDHGVIHVAFNYVVKNGEKIRKDTKTHQERWDGLDSVSCQMLREHVDRVRASLAAVDLELADDAYLFSNDPEHAAAWNPDWISHKVSGLADAIGIDLTIKTLRHYTASQLLAAGFDLANTAARLGHGSGGAVTLKHYADPVSEADRRAAAFLSDLTGSALAPQ